VGIETGLERFREVTNRIGAPGAEEPEVLSRARMHIAAQRH